MKKRSKGFTLVELLVVIAIIGILAAVVAPNAFKSIEKAKVSTAISDYKAFKTAALNYYGDTGIWPATTTNGNGGTNAGTANLLTDSTTHTNGWNGPYLEKWPSKNPWGGTYTFYNGAYRDWDGNAGNDAARYIQLTNVPSEAILSLQDQLGNDIVQSNGTTVYILINR